MKCLVCHKEFVGGVCPRCGYPVIEAPDVDALLETLRPQIENYRHTFLDSIRIELEIYRWKEDGDVVVLDHKELLSFGSYPSLEGKVSWLSQQFARNPDAQTLELRLHISVGDNTIRPVSIPIRNLMEASLQQIGIEATDDLRFRLKLRNEAGSISESAWIEL